MITTISLAILLDAFRFHRLRREWTARILFLLCLLVNLVPVLVPGGQGILALRNFDPEVDTTMSLLGSFDVTDLPLLLSMVLAPAISSFIALLYANLYVDDLEKRTDGHPIRRTILSIPRLAGLGILLLVPSSLGFLFAFIPNIVIALATCLSPLLITAGKRRTVEAILDSYNSTNRFKMRILVLDAILVMGMSLPANLLALPFAAADGSGAATGVVSAFFAAMTWLMLGRLHGMLYHLLVSKAADVIPSAEIKE